MGKTLGNREENAERYEIESSDTGKAKNWKLYSLANHYKASLDAVKAARDIVLGPSETADNSLPAIDTKK
jgi:hypothetical protein